MAPSTNPRYRYPARRAQVRRRLLARETHCALCGKPIDKGLRTPHPMSAEVDEIVPVSKGGSPIDMENVQLTHRVCNQRAGDKSRPRKARSFPLPTSQDW
ncbi:MAG: HNH endonuclease [Coriobacteriia bacterium]|nr:HNH endonuclease [Coriobacteriia bacterium]